MTLRMFDADNEWIGRIHAHFQQRAVVQYRLIAAVGATQVPTRRVLAEMLDVAFWASLITNEGRPTRVRIAVVPVDSAGHVLRFKHSLPFTKDEVARLAPASWLTGWFGRRSGFRAAVHLGYQPKSEHQ